MCSVFSHLDELTIAGSSIRVEDVSPLRVALVYLGDDGSPIRVGGESVGDDGSPKKVAGECILQCGGDDGIVAHGGSMAFG